MKKNIILKNEKRTQQRIERDKKIYQWYLNFVVKNGRAPTLKEIGNSHNISRERARQLLERLEKQGYLIRIDNIRKKNIFALNPSFIIKEYEKRKSY